MMDNVDNIDNMATNIDPSSPAVSDGDATLIGTTASTATTPAAALTRSSSSSQPSRGNKGSKGQTSRGSGGKQYRAAAGQINRGKLYQLDDALGLLPGISPTKFDATVELAVNLGVDPKKADQNIRGAVPLPHGRGKMVRIIVFAKGDKALEVSKMGVEAVGGQDLADKIQGGWIDFDQVVATPDMMGIVGKLGRVLGPRGLMPNPKLGTVTLNIKQAVTELQAGRVEYHVDKAGIVHVPVGKVSMDAAALKGNIGAIMEALQRARPQSAKGSYVKKVAICSTMSPGIKLDPLSCTTSS